jgi:hypothetical protein
VSLDSSKLIAALGFQPFDPWPFDDALVPPHRDWHRERPAGEPRSPQYMLDVLACNPARRSRGGVWPELPRSSAYYRVKSSAATVEKVS